MKQLVIFVTAPYWRGTNPIVMEADQENLEEFGRSWARSFTTDIVMVVE